MTRTRAHEIAALLMVFSLSTALSQPAAGATLAGNIYTPYNVVSPSQISWITCGSTTSVSGCSSFGTLGSLSNACAIMESLPHVIINTATEYVATRQLYVMDSGTTSSATKLNIYGKTDIITPSNFVTTITLGRQLALPLTGGNVKCFMAGNATALFMGTNQTTNAAELTIADLVVTTIPGFTPPINVSQITGSDHGFVSVNFGSTSGSSGFYLYGPNGGLEEDGGGNALTINNVQGIQLTSSAASGSI